MKRLILFLAVSLTFNCNLSAQQVNAGWETIRPLKETQSTAPLAVQKSARAMCRVTVNVGRYGRNIGTGVFVKSCFTKGMVKTCGHLLQLGNTNSYIDYKNARVFCEWWNGEKIQGRVSWVDHANDVMVVELDHRPNIEGAPVANRGALKGDKVWFLGYKFGLNNGLTYRQGTVIHEQVRSTGGTRAVATGNSISGMSGGPVILSNGYVVGNITQTDDINTYFCCGILARVWSRWLWGPGGRPQQPFPQYGANPNSPGWNGPSPNQQGGQNYCPPGFQCTPIQPNQGASLIQKVPDSAPTPPDFGRGNYGQTELVSPREFRSDQDRQDRRIDELERRLMAGLSGSMSGIPGSNPTINVTVDYDQLADRLMERIGDDPRFRGPPGRDGKDGRDGIDGKNGVDGQRGSSGSSSPQISSEQLAAMTKAIYQQMKADPAFRGPPGPAGDGIIVNQKLVDQIAAMLPPVELQPAYKDESGNLVPMGDSLKAKLGQPYLLPPNEVEITSPTGKTSKTQAPMGLPLRIKMGKVKKDD